MYSSLCPPEVAVSPLSGHRVPLLKRLIRGGRPAVPHLHAPVTRTDTRAQHSDGRAQPLHSPGLSDFRGSAEAPAVCVVVVTDALGNGRDSYGGPCMDASCLRLCAGFSF